MFTFIRYAILFGTGYGLAELYKAGTLSELGVGLCIGVFAVASYFYHAQAHRKRGLLRQASKEDHS